jgi:DNA ligase (NAD+)
MGKLTAVPEIGPRIASSIMSYFADNENREIISRLKKHKINFSTEESSSEAGNALTGKTIVISGVFQKHTRDEYKEIIERNGGKNSSSVSGNTSFILAGENMGPSKRTDAEALGVPLINESEFLKIIDEE